MHLTAQQLSEVIACLRAGTSSGGAENRRFSRMPVHAAIRITTLANEVPCKSYTILTQDISFGGFGFLQAIAAQKNDTFVAHLPYPTNKTLFIVSRVSYCRALADGLHGIGAEFVSTPDKQLLQQLAEANDHELQRIRNSILY